MITITFSVYNRQNERIGEISEKVEHAYCDRCGDCLVCSHDVMCWDGLPAMAIIYAENLLDARKQTEPMRELFPDEKRNL